MFRTGDAVAGQQDKEEINDLHGEADGNAGHGYAAHDFARRVDVGGEDGDHQDSEREAGSPTPCGKEEADSAGDFQDAGQLSEQARIGKAGRDDADRVGYTEEVKHDPGQQERHSDEDAEDGLWPAEGGESAASEEEEGGQGKDEGE